MKKLQHILTHLTVTKMTGNPETELAALCIDSRAVVSGSLFIALRGTASDGHHHIGKAVDAGATAILCEKIPDNIQQDICYVQVPDTAYAAGVAAAAFFDFPSDKMKVTGVTGTNGKTTIATLLYQLFTGLGYPCGLVSTVENRILNETEAATHTTPDAVRIQALLARMAAAGCAYVFMEVSSHAIDQQRIAGIRFAGGIFTNITHDHLDYHKTFDAYIRVKKTFFDQLPKTAFALTNADDKRGSVMLQNTCANRKTYGLYSPADFKGKILENNLTGLIMMIGQIETHFRMAGSFNASNLLAVYGTALLLDATTTEVLPVLSNLTGAPGRFETFLSPREKVLGIVDYAHTPDALINITGAINQLRKDGRQMITVIGCGGDRDKTKRPLMAQVAAMHSNKAIFTADNPRSEDPEVILNEMEAGLSQALRSKTLRITDRREAIKTACTLAQPEDIVLVAGKGHETWQEIKGVKYPFDDRVVLREIFELLNK